MKALRTLLTTLLTLTAFFVGGPAFAQEAGMLTRHGVRYVLRGVKPVFETRIDNVVVAGDVLGVEVNAHGRVRHTTGRPPESLRAKKIASPARDHTGLRPWPAETSVFGPGPGNGCTKTRDSPCSLLAKTSQLSSGETAG